MGGSSCRRCHQRLVRPDETDALLRPRLVRIVAGQLLVRCHTCGAWCPCSPRLIELLLRVMKGHGPPQGVAEAVTAGSRRGDF